MICPGGQGMGEVMDGEVGDREVDCEDLCTIEIRTGDGIGNTVHLTWDVEDSKINSRFYACGDGMFDDSVKLRAAS